MSDYWQSGSLVLVLDSASPFVFVGLWREGKWLATRQRQAPALDCLFELVNECLADVNGNLKDISALVYDEGPGSVLGIRVCVMGIRTWMAMPTLKNTPVYSFLSLEMLAAQIDSDCPQKDFEIVADYRKNEWLSYRHSTGVITTVDDAEISSHQSVYHLAQRKAWRSPPAHAHKVTLDLASRPELLAHTKLLRYQQSPGVFSIKPVEYKRWTASS